MCTAVKKKQKCLLAFGQCFSALPAFSSKFPRAFATQQYTRRHF